MTDNVLIRIENLTKTFVLHTQGGARIPVFSGVDFTVSSGDCLVLSGPSGSGKSTLLRSLYANYKPGAGRILVRHRGGEVDMVSAEPRAVLDVRRHTMGYVSQFLRVIPRVPTRDVVADPLLQVGTDRNEALRIADGLLERLNMPRPLWDLPPATFSGGEQQRVNIARGFAQPFPLLLLDEPTASLDAANRQVVIGLIEEARQRGTAIVGIFHDHEVRDAVGTRSFDVTSYRTAA